MKLPTHLAMVMDGNGRWANRRMLPRLAGHKQGVEALRRCVRDCAGRGISILTVYAFSQENWGRPQEEVSGLMELFGRALTNEVDDLIRNDVQLRFIGDRTSLSASLVSAIEAAERSTCNCRRMRLNVCFNYSGRWDIVQAAQQLMTRGEPITEEGINKYLAFADCPEPDLFIRSGGEHRLSNFLLWQLAYTELFWSDILWPDWDEAAMDAALAAFDKRQRRFGKLPDASASSKASGAGAVATVQAG